MLDPDRLAALLRGVALDHDRRAFISLFGLLAPRVKGFAMRLGADAETAEEIMQDVMLTVWRSAAQFDAAQGSVVTWVYTITRNRRIDRLRHERRPDWDPTDPILVPAVPESAEQTIEIGQREHSLRLAIDSLPPAQAELLRMAYFQDMTQTDIATQAKLPLGTVKSRLRLALARLRLTLSAAGEI